VSGRFSPESAVVRDGRPGPSTDCYLSVTVAGIDEEEVR
jgi:hypothetical protein